MPQRRSAFRSLAAGLAITALLAGVGGCGAQGADELTIGPEQADGNTPGPTLSVPKVFYLKPHGDRASAEDKIPFRIMLDDGTGRPPAAGVDGKLTLTVVGPGNAVGLKTYSPRERCAGNAVEVTCTMAPEWSNWAGPWLVSALATSHGRPGDESELRYRYTTGDGTVLTGRTRLVVGEPVLQVKDPGTFADLRAGGEIPLPVTVRNTGEVAAEGLGVGVLVGEGLSLESRAGNCRYADNLAVCALPGLRIQPGETVRLAPPLLVRSSAKVITSSFVQEVWPLDLGPRANSMWPTGGKGGQGPALAPTAGVGSQGVFSEGAKVSTEVKFAVSADSSDSAAGADYEAVGDSVRGKPGSEQEISVGVRNLGPAKAYLDTVRITVPPGTTVVTEPRESVDIDASVPACEVVPGDRTYSCRIPASLERGQSRMFDFTLRIDEENAGSGEVAISPNGWDPNSANDTASITVNE